MKKRILYINLRSHAIERMEPVFAALRSKLNVTLVSDSVPDVDETLFEDILITNTFDERQCLQEVKKYNEKKQIQGVLTWSDKDVPLMALIGKELGIRTLPIEASLNVRNKFKMRERVSHFYPNLCPKFLLVKNYEQLLNAYESIGTPAIFKPVGASGSKAIFKVNNQSDLQSIYEQMSEATTLAKDKIYTYFPQQYIYEEYIEGEEISVEGIIENREITIAGITDKKVTNAFSLEYQEIFPSKFYEQYYELIRSSISNIVNILDLKYCAFHAECKFDEKSKELKLIEIAGRPGGGFITSHLIPFSSGVSFHEQLIKVAIGEKLDKKLDISRWYDTKIGFSGHLDCMAEKEGKLTKIEGIDRTFEDPNVVFTVPTTTCDTDIVFPPKDFSSLFVTTSVVKAQSYKDIEKTFEGIKSRINIQVRS